MAPATGTVERRTLRFTLPTAITIVGLVVGLVVARAVFVAAHRPLSWAAAAVAAAVLLDPVVDWLAPYIRRAPAVLVTLAALAVVGVGTTYLRTARAPTRPAPAPVRP
jgi:predicted PurR-regulated permease PerM